MCKRRNRIIKLLSDWGLIEIVKEDLIKDAAPSQIKVIAFKEKGDWTLESKYNIGKKRQVVESYREPRIYINARRRSKTRRT